MDNIAHTLAGIALAEAGLRRKTGLATATLAIGANLPDVDALIYVVGSNTDALAFRRGWTHGILAMLVLPLVLAGIMLAWNALVRQRRGDPAQPVHPGWLLAVAAIGTWSHPLLDLLNTYGVRLLMPFSGRWFYGDTLFIVDPWLWASLAVGIVLSRVRRRRQSFRPELPTRLGLAALLIYVVAMASSSRLGRAYVDRETREPALRTMVAPQPVTPFSRAIVRDLGAAYEYGWLRWSMVTRYDPGEQIPVGRDSPGVQQAHQDRDVAAFLSWSRFPLFTTVPGRDSTLIRITDIRYPGQAWASVEVVVPTSNPRLATAP